MVHVLLVAPPHRDTFGYSMPPLGALHLGATARRRGHRPQLLDLALLLRRGELPGGDELIDACVRRILVEEPEVLGLGAMISALPAALHLAAEVRRLRPRLPIILGGQGPETVELALLARHPAVDLVAVGEADETLSDVLDVLGAAERANGGADRLPSGRGAMDDARPVLPAALFEIPGLALRRDGAPCLTAPRPLVADLDQLDLPAFDLAESPAAYAAAARADTTTDGPSAEEASARSSDTGAATGPDDPGDQGEVLFPIDLGRGCSYGCSFCTTSVFWGRSVRYLSPGRAADAFDRLAALVGMEHGGCVYVTHDLFTADRQRVLDICAEKRRRGNTLPWECRTRIDLVDEELLRAMAAAGCRRILYGVESDSEAVLEAVHKGGRQGAPGFDVRAVLALASAAGVASIVGVMVGVPGESEEDVEANLQLLADAAVIDGTSLSLHWFNVTPGNGQAQRVAGRLSLIPGLHADLVRGHDMPAGQLPGEQAAMIAADAELFAGFRVFAPPWTTPRQLFLLTRNAAALLEVLPRSLKAFALARGTTLVQTLCQLLGALADGDHCPEPAAEGAERSETPSGRSAAVPLASAIPNGPCRCPEVGNSTSAPLLDAARAARFLVEERAEHGTPWDELLVLKRDAAVRLTSALLGELCAESDELPTATLLSYERALFETTDTTLRRFLIDPLPLVRAMDEGRWPAAEGHREGGGPAGADGQLGAGEQLGASATPRSGAPSAVLFSRRGERVAAHTLSPFLADAFECGDDAELLCRWPDASSEDLNRSRQLLSALQESDGSR